jgi:hypothetical protein
MILRLFKAAVQITEAIRIAGHFIRSTPQLKSGQQFQLLNITYNVTGVETEIILKDNQDHFYFSCTKK